MSPKDLNPRYRVWLEEEVVYIITPREKEVFLQLDTDRERELFIDAFWRHRDPNPTTPENEYRDEHYRRIKYANERLGKEGPGAGWRSAMGRIYIILGEPNYVETFENLTEVYPMVIWFYEASPEKGLYQAFKVAFFKRQGIGEYELYSPIRFGPQFLLPHFQGDPADYMAAYNELRTIEPSIAETSLTLLPNESAFSLSPSLASEIMLNSTIPAAPHKLVEDAWAEKLLAYKDVVEVEYSTNFIESDAFLSVVLDRSGTYFVHYLIEPSRLTFEQYEGRFLSNLEVNGSITDQEGNTVYQYEKIIPFEFDQGQMNSIRNKLFSFQDMFPLISGDYKLNVLMKNRVSKEFTSVEARLSIPEDSSGSLMMTAPILANRALRNTEFRGKSKPFLFNDIQLVPSPRNDFSQQDHLYLFLQLLGLSPGLKESGTLSFTITSGDRIALEFQKKLDEYPDALHIFEDIPLSDFAIAYYKLKVALLDRDQTEIQSKSADFYISHVPALPRPWLLSLPLSSPEDPSYLNIMGNQYLNKNNLPEARRLLEAAYRRDTQSAKFALDFCQALFDSKEYLQVKEIGRPFLDRPEKHEFYAILGQSCQMLGEFAEAISHYQNYLTYYGTNIQILNSVGECLYQLGNTEEALTAWERSLELEPGQEQLKKRVASIKEKK